jgi:macrolide-specific efflux system membrane fusion protein
MKRYKSIALLAALILLLSSCFSGNETVIPLEESVEVKYDTAEVVRKDLYIRYQYEAYVRAAMETASYGKKTGILEEFYVRTGDIVKKGDPIARLDVSMLEQQIASLRDNLSHRKKKLEYDLEQKQYDIELAEIDLEALRSSGTSDSEIELARLAVEKLEAEKQYIRELGEIEIKQTEDSIAGLEVELEGAVALAPCDGEVVSLAMLNPGDRVPAYMTIAHIADKSQLYVHYDGSDQISSSSIRYIANIRGREYELAPIEYDRDEYITLVLSGKRPPYRFSFVDESEGIEAGDFAALMAYTQEAKDVLVVPSNSLYFSSGQNYVYRLVNGEKVYTEVTCGIRTDSYVEIKSGLEEGDEVFVKQ